MIKVFSAKDLIKYFIRFLIPIIVLFLVLQTVSKQKIKIDTIRKEDKALIGCISDTIMQIKMIKEEPIKEKESKNFIFLSELEILESIKNDQENDQENDQDVTETNGEASQNGNVQQGADGQQSGSSQQGAEDQQGTGTQPNNNGQNTGEIVQAQTGVTTEVVPNDVNPRITNDYNGVSINNMSSKTLTYDMLVPNIEVNKSKVIIYHTHTCESYTPTETFNYEMTGNYRSTNLDFSVARVGDELEGQLNSYGIEVVHDKTYHDHPAYNGSYSRSLITAQNALANNPETEIIIDLHRDAIADASYAPKVKIGDEYASQLMFVIGANNENYVNNLKFAIKVMEKANELYPGLFKPIILRNAEYNQHLTKASCIIEVGATGNTLEESMNSMKYLAKVINEI